jgi:alpha,alpha-trehalase
MASTHSVADFIAKVADLPPPCDSQIWGAGCVIDAVQRARIFEDSKTFVDLKLNFSEEEIVENYSKLPMNKTREQLKDFVTENFSLEEDCEFEEWDPVDWQAQPKFLNGLSDKALIHVGLEVNKLWKLLSRKCSTQLKDHPGLFSKIYLPHGFIMPGGRFKEIYYWDTYWIIRGLLISEMFETVKGILENFFEQLDTFGHIPNGTRKYYSRRSQPPFLTSMMSKYVEVTDDMDFLRKNMPALEKELKFFEENRCTLYKHDEKDFQVFFYGADCSGPRPESYFEDVECAEALFKTNKEKEEFYLHMKAAAESGWDFSSRWFIDEKGGNVGELTNAKTCYIAPVDLNSLMYKNYVIMAQFCILLDEPEERVQSFLAKV